VSHEERNVLTEILANAIIIGLFLWFLVAASIVIGIVLAVVMAIVWRVVTGEKPDLTRDERDRAISGIGWKVQGIATAIGVVGAVGARALGHPVITAMNLIFAGCAFGDAGGNLAKLRAYRRGL